MLTESRIIVKAAMCVWHCKVFDSEIKSKSNLRADYEVVREMVEYWVKNYEEESRLAGVN
jgi:hypothetical protein